MEALQLTLNNVGQLRRGHPRGSRGQPRSQPSGHVSNAAVQHVINEEEGEEVLKRKLEEEETQYDIKVNAENWEKALATRKIHVEVKKEEKERRLGEKRKLIYNSCSNEEKLGRLERRILLDTLLYMEFHALDDEEIWAVTDLTATLPVCGKFDM